MNRKERSRSRSASGIRQHKRQNKVLIKKDKNYDSSSDTENEQPIKNRRKFSLLVKKKYIEQYKEIKSKFPKKGYGAIASQLNIPKSCLIEWLKQESYIEQNKNLKNKFRLEGGGRNPSTLLLEDTLIKWVAEQRRLEIGISTNEIIYKLIELDPNQNKRSFHALQVWCYAFLRRYGYGIRAITHAGQKLKENSKIEYEEFFRKLYSLRFQIEEDHNMCNIYNMDETPIWFEMISKNTVTKLGEKTVTVRTFGSERTRITVILCTSADGQKIPLY